MDTGNTAWVLISTALVLFMTPGLAFFYGGMVRAKNVLGMLMQNFFAMGLLGVLWVVVVFTLAFGDSGDGGCIGNLDFVWLQGRRARPCRPDSSSGSRSPSRSSLFCAYQMTFAIITPALITGATADRLKFSAYAVFIGVWLVLVYAPVAHWVFAGGWLAEHGRARLRRWGRRAHQRRRRRAGRWSCARQAQGLAGDADAAAQPAADHARHRHPVVRLGRVQRRLGPRGRRHRRPGAHEHLPRRLGRHARLAGRRADQGRARHHPRRRVGRGGRPRRHHAVRRLRRRHVARSTSASSPASSAASPSASRSRFGFDDSLDVVAVHLVGGLVGSLLLGLFADAADQPGRDARGPVPRRRRRRCWATRSSPRSSIARLLVRGHRWSSPRSST